MFMPTSPSHKAVKHIVDHPVGTLKGGCLEQIGYDGEDEVLDVARQG